MPRRSRSRSPRRERKRSRSRDRERDRRPGGGRRSRSPEGSRRRRSRSPRRRSRTPDRDRERRYDRRERSRSHDRDNPDILNKVELYQRPPLDASAFEGKSEEEIDMMKVMGFGDFDTTKGKKVPGNDVSATNITQKRRYRQYMNRRGGFNRPLDSIA